MCHESISYDIILYKWLEILVKASGQFAKVCMITFWARKGSHNSAAIKVEMKLNKFNYCSTVMTAKGYLKFKFSTDT